MATRAELLTKATKCDEAANGIFKRIKGQELKPHITDDGERQAPQDAIALGALRGRAQSLREQAALIKKAA